MGQDSRASQKRLVSGTVRLCVAAAWEKPKGGPAADAAMTMIPSQGEPVRQAPAVTGNIEILNLVQP